MMEVTPQATSDPLLVRVWWVDVGRVAGDCSYDDTRWGCKNDPTMGKKDNPNRACVRPISVPVSAGI